MGLDSVGGLKWYKQYGSFNFFYYDNIFVNRTYYQYDNHIYFAGSARDSATGRTIGVFIKFDYNGDTLWRRIYKDPDPLEDLIPQMVTTSVDGGFLLTGFFQYWGTGGGRNCLLIKTDANGKELWRKKISKGAPNTHDGKAIVQDSATKKIVIVGYQYKPQPGIFGNVLILDSLGNSLNQQAFIQGVLTDLAQLPDKSFVTCGTSSWQDAQSIDWYQGYIARFNLNTGTFPDWNYKIQPSTKNSALGPLKVLPNGNILTMGNVDLVDTVYYMTKNLIQTTTVDRFGKLISSRTYNYKYNAPTAHFYDAARFVECTSDGGWVAAIELTNNQRPNPFFFVKYDSTGCDSTTAYCESLVAGVNDSRSAGVRLDIFPNPAAGLIKLNFMGENPGEYDLSITDVTGKEVMRVSKISGRSEIDVSGLPNGLYFVRPEGQNKTFRTAKLIISR